MNQLPTSERISVLLVDNHPLVRQGVRSLLETHSDIEVVMEVNSGEEAVEFVSDQAPDVVLMDLIMPGMGGVEATRQVRRISPNTQVVILTSFHDDQHVLPAMRAGALSYLLKDVIGSELADAVRKASRREVVLSPYVASQIMRSLGANASAGWPQIAELSEREHEVLRLIAAGEQNVAIAEKLVISIKTVRTHVSNILSKLHLADRTQAAVFAWKSGLVQREREF